MTAPRPKRPMSIVARAIELLTDNTCIGLGSGRAARAFVRALGEKVTAGTLHVRGVPTSKETAALAKEVGVPLVGLEEARHLDVTIDGADEVDPNLDLIKGYGRALVREKIVAAASRQLVILVGEEKLVHQLGTRHKLPVEVVPFGLPYCLRRFEELGFPGTPHRKGGRLFESDNGNYIVDLEIGPIADPMGLERLLNSIPGVVDSGLFLRMADVVLVGAEGDLGLVAEKRREPRAHAPSQGSLVHDSPSGRVSKEGS